MARFLLRALTCLAPAALAVAQPTPASTPSPSPAASMPGGPHDHPPMPDGGTFQRFKKKLEQMTPEERERFKENWQRWKEMGDRERAEFKQRAAQ